jgi:hypothetical protein
MPHIYLLFDFSTDEEKAQLARHKLEVWKQASRLDKKLLYKFERELSTNSSHSEAKPASPKKEKSAKKEKPAEVPAKSSESENVRLFVRLGFSSHEKLTEHRWLERIPAEEPFKTASPTILKPSDPSFAATEQQFEELS